MFKFILSLILLQFLAAGTALAAERPFDQASFDALQAQGKPILVMVQAGWCPTCRAQKPIVEGLLKTPELASINALRVDFDKQKPVVKAFKVQLQSTLIVFKGRKEVGRSTGETRKDAIAALLMKAI